jgi:hypothetical protein
LVVSPWLISALGESVQGFLCLVEDEEGNLRAEILINSRSGQGQVPADSVLPELLQQSGEGYTLILGDNNDGTYNPWRQRWETLDPALGNWIRVLGNGIQETFVAIPGARKLEATGSLRASGRRFGGPSAIEIGQVHRFQLMSWSESDPRPGSVPEKPNFRKQLVERHSGRGGDGEILQLVLASNSGTADWLVATSSRKPGRLVLGPPVRYPTGPLDLEVFIPLWPLADLLEIPGK